MELSEYNDKLKILEEEFVLKLKVLHTEYAMSNNTIHEGDIFTDHLGSIKVDRIEQTFASFDNIPSCIYYGLEVKKDGTPKKKANYRWAYQSNQVNK